MRSAVAAEVAVTAALVGLVACDRRSEPTPAPAASAAQVVAEAASAAPASPSAPPPVDRLAPGELQPGSATLFGLVLPRGMRVSANFGGKAHATGPLPAEDVANYLRDRVDVRRVELGAVGTVFPSVHIHGGDPSHVYRIEVNPSSGPAGERTELIVEDVTPVPLRQVDPSIPVEERWRRAGFTPDGKQPLDKNRLR